MFILINMRQPSTLYRRRPSKFWLCFMLLRGKKEFSAASLKLEEKIFQFGTNSCECIWGLLTFALTVIVISERRQLN